MDLKDGIEILVSNSLRKLARKKEPKIITHRYLNNYLMYECDEVSVFYVKKNDIGFRSICNYFIRTEPYGNESPNIEKIKWINEIVVVKYVEEYLCFFDDFIVNEPIKPRNGLLWNIEIYDIWSNPDPHTVKYGKIKGIGILLRQLGFYDFLLHRINLLNSDLPVVFFENIDMVMCFQIHIKKMKFLSKINQYFMIITLVQKLSQVSRLTIPDF